MKIAIIDADLIGRKRHRFPNLVCEKISGYYKENENDVILKTDYDNLSLFDKVFVSKVFTDTHLPEEALNLPNVSCGGTGFYFDKALALPYEIEHHMPDYHLYDDFINKQIRNGKNRNEFNEYTDYSIGFMTRGCFRKCPFCVNQKYDHVFVHSPLEEFYDESRKKICLLDDNFLGCQNWRQILDDLIATGKPFKFKQGMDERLLTDEKCKLLFSAKYDGDYTFAFDNISDYDLIHRKLKMIRQYTNIETIKFYVLVGFEGTGKEDIENMFKRIELLMRYHCLPYIMRFQNKNETPWKESKYKAVYITVASWCNQPSFFKKKSFREFAELRGGTGLKALELCKDIEQRYIDMRWEG